MGDQNIFLVRKEQTCLETSIRVQNAIDFVSSFGVNCDKVDDVGQYLECLDRAKDAFQDKQVWTKMAV